MRFYLLKPHETKPGKFQRVKFNSLMELCQYLEIPVCTHRHQLLNFGYRYKYENGNIIVEEAENYEKGSLKIKYEKLKKKHSN